MDSITLHSIWTVLVFVTFVGIVIWAWSGKRREDFEEAARLPLEDDPSSSGAERPGEPRNSAGELQS